MLEGLGDLSELKELVLNVENIGDASELASLGVGPSLLSLSMNVNKLSPNLNCFSGFSTLKQLSLNDNYLSFNEGDNDFAQRYLPELYEQEVERYGNRTLSGFLRMVGAEMPMASDQVIWSEQNRLHVAYNDVSCTGAATLTFALDAAAGKDFVCFFMNKMLQVNLFVAFCSLTVFHRGRQQKSGGRQ